MGQAKEIPGLEDGCETWDSSLSGSDWKLNFVVQRLVSSRGWQ